MGIVIPAPAPFNMQVFKIPVPITRGGKIFPSYPPRCGYYPRVFVGASFFDIPIHRLNGPGNSILRLTVGLNRLAHLSIFLFVCLFVNFKSYYTCN